MSLTWYANQNNYFVALQICGIKICCRCRSKLPISLCSALWNCRWRTNTQGINILGHLMRAGYRLARFNWLGIIIDPHRRENSRFSKEWIALLPWLCPKNLNYSVYVTGSAIFMYTLKKPLFNGFPGKAPHSNVYVYRYTYNSHPPCIPKRKFSFVILVSSLSG